MDSLIAFVDSLQSTGSMSAYLISRAHFTDSVSSVTEIVLLYLMLGAVAGLLSGLFGIGGGLVLVPVLLWTFDQQGFGNGPIVLMAVATSLATIIVTSYSSIRAHHKLGAVVWPIVYKLAPTILLGSIVGSVIADRLPNEFLKNIFAIYLLLVSVQLAMQYKPQPAAIKQAQSVMLAAGAVIGTLSAALGIGGGTLTVPFLLKCHLPMRNAVAVSSACGFPIALAGTVSYALLGMDSGQLPPGSLGYVYLPAFGGIIASSMLFAPVGAKLVNRLPTQQLKRGFALLLLLVAVKMLI